MKRLIRTLLWIVLFSAINFSFAQKLKNAVLNESKAPVKTLILEDSLLLAQPDTLKSLLLKADSLKIKLIFKNDHRWNNWAIDTTIKALNDAKLIQRLCQRPPYKLSFQYIPLKPQVPTTGEKIKKYLKPGLAAITLFSNWSSFYFKRVADDYYDKYKYTSDINKINYYYNKTQQYDQISNVLLTVSVITLSAYLYLLLQ